jgi:putative ABC transport system permease protein
LDWTVVRSHRGPIYVLFGAVGFLLLIACANAANLLLARSAARQKEIAVRVALGAGKRRIFRLLLSEGLLLSAASSALGCLLAIWFVSLIRLLGPADVPRLNEVQVDLAALVFALSVALLTGLLLALVPAWQASAMRMNTALKEEGFRATGRVGRGIRKTLVVAEVALSVVLLAGAGLMIQTFYRLTNIDSGFRPASVITMHLSLPVTKYVLQTASAGTAATRQEAQAQPKDAHDLLLPRRAKERPTANDSPGTKAAQTPVQVAHRELLRVIADVPGVVSAGATQALPLSDPVGMLWIDVPGAPQGTLATMRHVAGDYFHAISVPLVAGRYFETGDFVHPDEHVIVSRSLARRFWKNPIGQRLEVASEKHARVIVGVVEDTAMVALNDETYLRSQFYVPSEKMRGFALVVRGRGRAEDLAKAVRAAVASFDKELPVYRVQTMSEVVSKSVGPQRFRGQLFGVFAAAALALTLVGLAAVISYSVATRTHEMGVRMALGAERSDLVRMVLAEGARMTLVGTAAGLLGAWWLSRYIGSLLYGVSATDPWTYAGAAVVLVVGGLLAALLPALRASRVDPAVALRYE